MTQTTLRKLADAQIFKLNKNSKVTYKVILKEKRGIVFTSLNSMKSYNRIGRTRVFIF